MKGAKERNAYDINLVYVDGEEFCFEEARAARRPYVEAPVSSLNELLNY